MIDLTEPLIERWFPVAAVDAAVTTPAGSGRSEKAIFAWFASRPIAQARAAVLTALLPDDDSLRALVDSAVISGNRESLDQLAKTIQSRYPANPPVVLDVFSGRGVIPLEAARIGAASVGLDLSPVATLAGRLLADYPRRDWSSEPPLPFTADGREPIQARAFRSNERLVDDVNTLLADVGNRVARRMEPYYPPNAAGKYPWGYLWTITMPCDGCSLRFPLLGSMLLRHPNAKTSDLGQAMFLRTTDDCWSIEVVDGPPTQEPTYSSSDRGDGKKRKGKAARCPFCRHVHPLETVKAKGFAGQHLDEVIIVAEVGASGRREFRLPTSVEQSALDNVDLKRATVQDCPYSSIPDELIPDGNVHTVMASGYGYRTFGELMCDRQTLSFIETTNVIRELHAELLASGISADYSRALTSFAAATLCRRLRLATRGARLRAHGGADGAKNNNLQVGDVFQNEASVNFQFDFFETGLGEGAGTWESVASTEVAALRKVVEESRGRPAVLRRGSATALPYRDGTVDAVITDPPYYDMIEYADASDVFHVWLKRILFDIEPDLFAPDAQQQDGLQNKNDEIIVRRVHEPARVRHDTTFYESMLAKAFAECRRVLRPDGHLVVIFGHSDPDAWRRLLGGLQDAGFVVTSAWPSRTETTNTGVASIRVTVTIGCRVAPADRRSATASQVEREIADLVRDRVVLWEQAGLALSDQLMAAHGPAMHVVGRYRLIQRPDGSEPDLEHFLAVGRRSVVDAHAFKVDEIPLDTFDAPTRFAIFWLRAFGRVTVNKGEAVFQAQSSQMRIDDLRPSILVEAKGGYALTLDPPTEVSERSAVFQVARALAAAWPQGGTEAAASVIAAAGLSPDDSHLWATVAELVRQLPESDKVAVALTACQRNRRPIESATRESAPIQMGEQLSLDTSGVNQ